MGMPPATRGLVDIMRPPVRRAILRTGSSPCSQIGALVRRWTRSYLPQQPARSVQREAVPPIQFGRQIDSRGLSHHPAGIGFGQARYPPGTAYVAPPRQNAHHHFPDLRAARPSRLAPAPARLFSIFFHLTPWPTTPKLSSADTNRAFFSSWTKPGATGAGDNRPRTTKEKARAQIKARRFKANEFATGRVNRKLGLRAGASPDREADPIPPQTSSAVSLALASDRL